jgi:integrase
MPAKSITDAFVRNVKLPKKEDKPNQVPYLDRLERGLSLMLVVSYGGSKTWRALTYDDAGKPQSVKLGVYPKMTVKAAREAARQHWQDPQKYAAETAPETVKDVGDKWLRHYVEAEGLISAPDLRRQLERYVFPRVGKRKFVEMRRGMINDLLDDVGEESGKGSRHSLLSTLSMLCNWYQSKHEHYTSPIVRGMRQTPRRARERILTDDEIRSVWAACDEMPPQYAAAIRLALTTAQRREKIAVMKRSDVDTAGVWSVRRDNPRQKGTPTKLKLPQMALDVLDSLPEIAGNDYYLATNRREHFNSFSKRKRDLDTLLPKDMPEWRFHDLRRTARSLMARAGVKPHIAELTLGHQQRGIVAVYDWYEYEPEMAQALESLAALIALILNPPSDNVVPLRA